MTTIIGGGVTLRLAMTSMNNATETKLINNAALCLPVSNGKKVQSIRTLLCPSPPVNGRKVVDGRRREASGLSQDEEDEMFSLEST